VPDTLRRIVGVRGIRLADDPGVLLLVMCPSPLATDWFLTDKGGEARSEDTMRSPSLQARGVRWLAFVVVLSLAACTGGGDGDITAPRDTVRLPQPIPHGDMSLEETLATRQSVRQYTSQPLTDVEISLLLWAAQGITREGRGRTAPSAGGLYPLDLYLVTAHGIFHYRPDHHDLEVMSGEDVRVPLFRAALSQEAVREAPAVFVVTAVFERTAVKYGDRAVRYVHLEAGHAAQNLLLEAVALGLGGVPIGAFDDNGVQGALGLSQDHEPLYIIPVGHPIEGS
jgi:SagB-type dehydrogenase family enzyme